MGILPVRALFPRFLIVCMLVFWEKYNLIFMKIKKKKEKKRKEKERKKGKEKEKEKEKTSIEGVNSISIECFHQVWFLLDCCIQNFWKKKK